MSVILLCALVMLGGAVKGQLTPATPPASTGLPPFFFDNLINSIETMPGLGDLFRPTLRPPMQRQTTEGTEDSDEVSENATPAPQGPVMHNIFGQNGRLCRCNNQQNGAGGGSGEATNNANNNMLGYFNNNNNQGGGGNSGEAAPQPHPIFGNLINGGGAGGGSGEATPQSGGLWSILQQMMG